MHEFDRRERAHLVAAVDHSPGAAMHRAGAVHLYFGPSDEPLSGQLFARMGRGPTAGPQIHLAKHDRHNILYGAFLVHFALGLFALYERRTVHRSGSELAQLLLGLAVPPLLANHLAGTRIAYAAYGIDRGYAQVLYSLWVVSPYSGILQTTLLIVAWSHGCIGIRFWLRLKPWFARVRGPLLCAAVLLPVLALLGFLQSGREVVTLAKDPGWRAVALAPQRTGAPAQNVWLRDLRDDFLIFDGGAVLLVLFARLVRAGLERRRPRFTVTYPDGRRQTVPIGFSVLEASRRANIPARQASVAAAAGAHCAKSV